MAQCMPSRQNTLTGDLVLSGAGIALGAFGLYYGANETIIAIVLTALKFGLVGIGLAILIISAILAINWHLRRKEPTDWIEDISTQPVKMRGDGAAHTLVIPAQTIELRSEIWQMN